MARSDTAATGATRVAVATSQHRGPESEDLLTCDSLRLAGVTGGQHDVVRCAGKSIELVNRKRTIRELERGEQRVVRPDLAMRREVEHRCTVHVRRETGRDRVVPHEEH